MPIHFEPDIPETLVPAASPSAGVRNTPSDTTPIPEEFARAVDGVTSSLQQAESAEDNFAHGVGSLENAVYERARADIALSVAVATTGRILQSVQSLFSMQV